MWDRRDRDGALAELMASSSGPRGFDLVIASDCLFFKARRYYSRPRTCLLSCSVGPEIYGSAAIASLPVCSCCAVFDIHIYIYIDVLLYVQAEPLTVPSRTPFPNILKPFRSPTTISGARLPTCWRRVGERSLYSHNEAARWISSSVALPPLRLPLPLTAKWRNRATSRR